MTERRSDGHGSASELLADWRAAARDTIAAQTAAKVATLALTAAEAADDAATAVAEAASSVVESVERARQSANRARKAAEDAAEAAQQALASAEGNDVRAAVELDQAQAIESAARDAYHDAERDGFPKRSSGDAGPST